MEPLRENKEKIRSFDVLSSVNQFRYDLENFGEIKAETREQVINEELSLICEGIDRSSRSSFVLKRLEGQLVYFNDGTWRPYQLLLEDGLAVAKAEKEIDPRKKILVDLRNQDKYYGQKMAWLSPGESMTWYSAYPENEAKLYGDDFMISLGFKPHRRMGFLYQASCQEDGSILLQSQTVDNCEAGAFQAIDKAKEFDPDLNLQAMMAVYDGYLHKKYSEYFFAGRTEQDNFNNIWDIIKSNEKLISFHIYKLENYARTNLATDLLEQAVKEHVASVWKMFKDHIDQTIKLAQPPKLDKNRVISLQPLQMEEILMYQQQANQSLESLKKTGQLIIVCGGSLVIEGSGDTIMDSEIADIFSSIFGLPKEEKYSFNKHMYCVVCQSPPKPKEAKKMCGPCGLCRDCDKQFKSKTNAKGRISSFIANLFKLNNN